VPVCQRIVNASLAAGAPTGQSMSNGFGHGAPHRRHSEGTMHSKQTGMTLFSFLIVVLVVGFFAYMAMKLVPAYTEFMGVQKAMGEVASENVDGKSPEEIRRDLMRKMDYQYVGDGTVQAGDITIGQGAQGSELRVSYDKDIPFIYNIDFLVHFEKAVPIQGNIAAPN
jgi:hypothetical protein